MSGRIGLTDVLFWLIIATIVYVMVRPGSPAGKAIAAFGDLFAAAVGVATGAAFQKGTPQ